jgi:hypothetical protein
LTRCRYSVLRNATRSAFCSSVSPRPGFDAGGRQIYRAYLRELGRRDKPIFEALQRIPGRLVIRTRRQLVSDAAWFRSVAWNEYHRRIKIDHQLTSVYRMSDT